MTPDDKQADSLCRMAVAALILIAVGGEAASFFL